MDNTSLADRRKRVEARIDYLEMIEKQTVERLHNIRGSIEDTLQDLEQIEKEEKNG